MKQTLNIVACLVVLMHAGCASFYRGKIKKDDEFAPLYPATQADVCWMMWGGGGTVLGVVDLPFSLVIDTVCLPYDVLTIGKHQDHADCSIVQATPRDTSNFLLISGKYWHRGELDRWQSAYKTTGILLSRRQSAAVVEGVVSGSAAEEAGVEPNDVILMVGTNNASMTPLGVINQAMLGDAGKTVEFIVQRPGESRQRTVTITVKAMTFEELKMKESNKTPEHISEGRERPPENAQR